MHRDMGSESGKEIATSTHGQVRIDYDYDYEHEHEHEHEHDNDALMIRRFRRFPQILTVRMGIGEKRIASI
jgi:hypothetical protein